MKNLRTTEKNGTIFVHVFDWPGAKLELSGVDARILSARLLATGQPLKFVPTNGGVSIEVPAQAPDPRISVIALKTL